MKVAVLVPAAGAGSRFKGKQKKQFTDMDGRAVFLRSIEPFADREDVGQVIMAIPAEDEELFNIKWSAKLAFYGVKVILGGSERYETVEKLLAEVRDDIDLVAMHDAVRPCVTTAMIDAVFTAAEKTGAAILAKRLVGTVKRTDPNGRITETVDRRGMWEAQTPQVFRTELIKQAYAERSSAGETITDDAQLVEAIGHTVHVVEADASNIKITTPADLVIAEGILKSRPKPKAKGPVGPWAAEQGW